MRNILDGNPNTIFRLDDMITHIHTQSIGTVSNTPGACGQPDISSSLRDQRHFCPFAVLASSSF